MKTCLYYNEENDIMDNDGIETELIEFDGEEYIKCIPKHLSALLLVLMMIIILLKSKIKKKIIIYLRVAYPKEVLLCFLFFLYFIYSVIIWEKEMNLFIRNIMI